MAQITKEQYQELKTLEELDYCKFLKMLENYTRIKAVPYIAFQFYDDAGDYICDSCDGDVSDLLKAAYVEVK